MKTCEVGIHPNLARSDGHESVDDRCWHVCGKEAVYERVGDSEFIDVYRCQRCYDFLDDNIKSKWVALSGETV
jgi:hypothetical protein